MRTIALGTLVAVACSLSAPVLAEGPTTRRPLPAKPQPEAEKGASERLVSIARTIKTGSTGETVETMTASLGKPAIAFSWCNEVGCVDHRSEVGSNQMHLDWSATEGEESYLLHVMLCSERPGTWQVASVTVSARANAPGAFGTLPKRRDLYREADVRMPGCMAL